ncbi:MAG: 2-oxo acid dehydrogenase subunit E2, partial [Chthoniobacterales bacterium]
MSIEVKIPAVGESITSGVLATWHKKDGESVASGDLLFTLETDKVSSEIQANDSGVLKTLVAEGDEVKIGQVVATIEAGAAAPAAKAKKEEPKKEEAKKPEPKKVEKVEEAPKPAAPVVSTPSAPAQPEGRITRKKMSPLRRKIAAQLVGAQQTAAILTTFNECDMSTVMLLRKQMQENFQKTHGVKLGFMSFFVKAVADALQAFPAINSRMDGDDLIQNHYYDIGVAVGTEKGLIVPVLRDCDRMSFADVERALGGYAQKARDGKIGLEDLQGGTFTISNGGVYGSLLSTPILNPPQSGILGMHKIQER